VLPLAPDHHEAQNRTLPSFSHPEKAFRWVVVAERGAAGDRRGALCVLLAPRRRLRFGFLAAITARSPSIIELVAARNLSLRARARQTEGGGLNA